MCPPLFHLKNQAGLDASYVDHNASGRDSTHPSRDISLLYLCTTAQVRQVIYKIIGRRRRAVIRGDPTFLVSIERFRTLSRRPWAPGADGAGGATGNHRGSRWPVVCPRLRGVLAQGAAGDQDAGVESLVEAVGPARAGVVDNLLAALRAL